ncbi:MAG: PAS domain-containing protein, partial [Gemmataceae bacterium]
MDPVELPDDVPLDVALKMLKLGLRACPFPVVMTHTELAQPGPTITYVNPAFEAISGYMAADIVGLTPRVLQGPRTDHNVLKYLHERLAAGKVFVGQTVNYHRDGTEYTVRWTIQPVLHRGQIVRFLSFQQRFAAPVIEYAPLSQEESTRFAELVVETTNVSIVVLDENFRLVRSNTAFAELVGRTPAELERFTFPEFGPPYIFEELEAHLWAFHGDEPITRTVWPLLRG